VKGCELWRNGDAVVAQKTTPARCS